MNFIKRTLFSLLGAEAYLYIVSSFFFIAYKLKLLKGDKDYDCHYFIKNLIKKNDVVIDLGANLGYYSVIFSKLVGERGRVHSIEPVDLFRKILSRNIKGRKNIEIIPYAIGTNDGEKIKMGVPEMSSHFSHGRTHILSDNEKSLMTFNATLKRPDTIFQDLKKLDYLKCDIEGYEGIAIPLFENILKKFKPTLQIEVAERNKHELMLFLQNLEYSVFWVKNGKMIHLKDSKHHSYGDLIFIQSDRISNYADFISS
jgi:FkbM family methyltransferase